MPETAPNPCDSWWCMDSGPGEPAWNMAVDEALLMLARDHGRPVLRWYSWTVPAATFGYSQRYGDVAGWTALRPLIRRPTGGGVVPHDEDWTYSVTVPPGHAWHDLRARESYCRIHQWVAAAFAELGVAVELASKARVETPGRCFAAGAEEADVLWCSRKIAGAAQRRNRRGLLIQGSIQPPPVALERSRFCDAMREVGSRLHGIVWATMPIAGEWRAQAAELVAARYGLTSFNESR